MQFYRVGGVVRDILLGFPYNEVDWMVVGGSPEALLKQGFRAVGKDFPVFLHPKTHEEYALARTERKAGQGYKGFVFYYGPDVSLEDDLKRRDLTINAMVMTDEGQVIDPYGGKRDLQAKLLRHVSAAFVEDPLRVVRVARFSARYHHLGFSVAPETQALMARMVVEGELACLTAERLWKECVRSLAEATPVAFFATLHDCGALAVLWPFWAVDYKQRQQQLQRVAACSDDPLIRFGALCVGLSRQSMQTMRQQLKIPKRFYVFGQCMATYAQAYQTCLNDPTQQLMLLEKLDAFRRPEHLERFIACCACLYAGDQAEQLRKAYQCCQAFDIKPLLTQYQGKAITEALHQQRLQVLTAMYNKESSTDES